MTPTDKYAERARELTDDFAVKHWGWRSYDVVTALTRALEQVALEARIDERMNHRFDLDAYTAKGRTAELRARLAELE